MKKLLRKFFGWLFPESLGVVVIPEAAYLFITTLQSNIGTSDTAMTLNSGVLKNGSALSGTFGFTIDAGTATQEFVLATAAGAAITGMSRGIDPLNPATSVTALKFPHRRGADVRISDYPILQIMKRLLAGQDAFPNKLLFGATAAAVTAYTPGAGATATIDLSLSNRNTIALPAGNITIALSNVTAGQIFELEILQDSVGSRTVTWFANIQWPGGSVPALTATANKRDVFTFVALTASTFLGFIAGQNL